MAIIISPLSCRNVSSTLSFVERYETYCVSLAERVRKASSKMCGGEDNLFTIEEEGETVGVISAGATLLHCIPNINYGMEKAFIKFFSDRSKKGVKTQCINGERCAAVFFTSVLNSMGQKAKQINNYLLLKMPLGIFSPAIMPPPPYTIVHCKDRAKAIDALMPLQEAYQKEEVLPKCRAFSPAASRLTIEKALHERRIAALIDMQGKITAMTAVNAIGINCVQIGGVYTVPEYRRKGFCRALVSSVTNAMINDRRQVVLYVRENNTAAMELYKGLGYRQFGRLCIVYY